MIARTFPLLLILIALVACAHENPPQEPAPEPEKPVRDPALDDPRLATRTAPETFRVRFETSKGNFVLQVERKASPHGADRFYNLVEMRFFDGCRFFRVVPGFVVQWGMNGDPRVTDAWSNAQIPDDAVTEHTMTNARGSISFASKMMPGTRTHQVFINLANNGRLDQYAFTPFGWVVEGMDVVDRLYSGYGDGPPRGNGPDQGEISQGGNAYLGKDFPKLDWVKSARVVAGQPE